MNHEDTETLRTKLNELSHRVIGLCIEVHRELGPGLLESAYEEALAYEFTRAGLAFERQREMPLLYKGVKLDCGYRLDFIVEGQLIFSTSAAQIDAALNGYGIAYLPENLVTPHIASGRLIQVLDDWSPLFSGYHLYYPSRRQTSPAFQILINALSKRA